MLCRLPLLQPPFTTLSDINASPNEYEAATDLICTALYTFSEDLGRYNNFFFVKTCHSNIVSGIMKWSSS